MWFFWVAAGVATQLTFVVTVWVLFWFFKRGTPELSPGSLGIDLLLTLQFAVVHSLLLHRTVRSRLERVIPSPMYGSFFSFVTCAGVLLTCSLWQSSSVIVWEATGWAGFAVEACYYMSWAGITYTVSLTGFGWQTGLTTWWPWIRNRPVPRRTFAPRGAYLVMRHPVYLSFLGLIWFNPLMTLDRLLLSAVWTMYIFVGSWLKDQRLLYYLGDRYCQYQAEVPGYPGFIGPLGRAPYPDAAVSSGS